MYDTTPATSRAAQGSQARVRSTRLADRARAFARAPHGTPLHETLSVGLGLARRHDSSF